jgi:hypothetical protein
MFVGHLAAAFLLPALGLFGSLAGLLLCCQLSDILFFTLVLSGVESMRLVPGFTATNEMDFYYMPWSHSLLGAAALALLVYVLTRRWSYALATISHWIGDLAFHTPDLTLAGGPVKYGFGLWQLKWVAFGAETVLLVLCVALFTRSAPRNERRAVTPVFWICLVMHTLNFLQVVPARSVRELGVQALFAFFAIPLLAYWLSRPQQKKQ